MTLASLIFSAFECYALHKMSKETSSGAESQGEGVKGSAGVVKLLELALHLAYLLYESATTEPPGVGMMALIGVACLAEVLLLGFEAHTVCKYDLGFGSGKVLPAKFAQQAT